MQVLFRKKNINNRITIANVPLLKGFCGYYDTVLDRIAPNVNKDCTKSAYPCPGVFNSSETYKCKFCFV